MNKLFCANDDIRNKLQDFLNDKNIRLSFSNVETETVNIAKGSDKPFCTCDIIYVDGAIDCEIARHMAVDLNITFRSMGQILDFLNIKIRNCSLGCFE